MAESEAGKASFRDTVAQFAFRSEPSMPRRLRSHINPEVTQSRSSTEEARFDKIQAVDEVLATTIGSEDTSTATRKRKATSSLNAKPPKLPRAKAKSSSQAISAINNLKDSVAPGLILISIGLNPGIMTGKTGHAYAHPSNRYWPTLHDSGITPVLHKPEETLSLVEKYGLGHTNIIPTKATVGGNDLTKDDYLEGAKILDEKIRELKPEAVMIVGKGIWEEWFRYKKGRKMTKRDSFDYGWQDAELNIGRGDNEWEGAKTFVATTTSGLSSSHTKEQRVAIWKPMGDWFAPKRDKWLLERGSSQGHIALQESQLKS